MSRVENLLGLGRHGPLPPAEIFQFKSKTINHLLIDGEPWFVAKDVCAVLYPGFNRYAGVTPYLGSVNADERRILTHKDAPRTVLRAKCYSAVFLNESGLYKLIMRCDKPVAKPFQDWVTREVLPAIRKTGGYLLNEDMRETSAVDSREEFPVPTDLASALRLAADIEERRLEQVKVKAALEPARALAS